MKVNSSVFNPEMLNAVIRAVGPGIGISSISSSIALPMTTAPGSEIPGVPASVISATECPE